MKSKCKNKMIIFCISLALITLAGRLNPISWAQDKSNADLSNDGQNINNQSNDDQSTINQGDNKRSENTGRAMKNKAVESREDQGSTDQANADLDSTMINLLDELSSRLDKVEKKSGLDRINFTGDYRFQAHKIQATMAAYYNAMQPQMLINSYDCDNDLLYTNRLRFNFNSEMTSNLSFRGRLAMYKTWGDSTGVQVFNGQSNSINTDGTTSRVPNSDLLRVERAFFTWDLFDSPFYLSIGRRPSTDGPPVHIRWATPMGGTPMGTLVDYQFDGLTLGCRLVEYLSPIEDLIIPGRTRNSSMESALFPGNTIRFCYGVGYDDGFGNAQNNGLDDCTMYGFDWDLYHNEDMFIQIMYIKAKDVTDGFNGLVVMPMDPATGQPNNNNYISRFSPSVNVGDLTLSGLVISRHDAFLHYFLSWAQMSSEPSNKVNPMFGGLFCDGNESPKSQSGNMVYTGVRADLDYLNGLMLGLEYNMGSQYWFNFTHGADDILGSKLATRGSVVELYTIFNLNRWANLRLSWQSYNYEYSGSGWHLGTPKNLDDKPVLGFPTYKKAKVVSLATTIDF